MSSGRSADTRSLDDDVRAFLLEGREAIADVYKIALREAVAGDVERKVGGGDGLLDDALWHMKKESDLTLGMSATGGWMTHRRGSWA